MLRISWSTLNVVLGAGGDLESRSTEHTLQFDCVTRETHEGLSVLTEHTTEAGAPLTDHKRASPDRVTIEAIVSQTPLGVPPPSGYESSVPVQTRQSTEGATVLVYTGSFDRIGDVLSTLRRLRLEATPVTLSTKHRTYDDVQIVGVTMPREPEDGDSVRLTVEIQEVRIAESRTVDVPIPREPRGARTRDRGGQEGEDSESRQVSTLQTAREEYARRREAGESVSDAALGAATAAFGG